MRYRPMMALAATAALIAAMPAHAAGVKKLDGKKTKVLTFTGQGTPQDNDANLISDQGGPNAPGSNPRPTSYGHCPKTRCLTFTFLYKPAKGVKPGPFSARSDWTLPGQDYDIYVVDSKGADLGHCGASAGQSEYVTIANAIPGHKYSVVVDEYRAVPDTVKATVSFPAVAYKPVAPVPDTLVIVPFACGLAG